MPPDLLNTICGTKIFLAAHENTEMRDISENDRYSYVREYSTLRYCYFILCIPSIEGLIRTGADYLTKEQTKPDIRHS